MTDRVLLDLPKEGSQLGESDQMLYPPAARDGKLSGTTTGRIHLQIVLVAMASQSTKVFQQGTRVLRVTPSLGIQGTGELQERVAYHQSRGFRFCAGSGPEVKSRSSGFRMRSRTQQPRTCWCFSDACFSVPRQ